jgi:hypothetical protein
MARLDSQLTLAQDITTLRRLIDQLLDDELPRDDLALVAATKLLNEKLERLRASSPDTAEPGPSDTAEPGPS